VTKGYVIDIPKRLSEIELWNLMQSSYQNSGVQAWSSGKVPHLLTTGPLLAKVYHRLVKAFLHDCESKGAFSNPAEPVYVVELGAGTGRLAWNFLFYQQRLLTEKRKIVYVLTDVVDETIEFWKHHKYFAAMAQQGIIDYANYNAAEDREINLLVSGKTISLATVANPMVFIANYLFDVLKQDLFSIDNTYVYEERIALVSDRQDVRPESEDIFSHLWMATSKEKIDIVNYYQDLFVDKILSQSVSYYREQMPATMESYRFLFPYTALKAIHNLSTFTDSKTMLLMAERPGRIQQDNVSTDISSDDKDAYSGTKSSGKTTGGQNGTSAGETSGISEAISAARLLAMGVHGPTFSLPVDTEILALGARELSSGLLQTNSVPVGLETCAFTFGCTEELPYLREEFHLSLEEQSPEELFLILRNLRRHKEDLSLADLVVALRASGYDSHFLFQIYTSLEEMIKKANPEETEEVARVLLEVDARHFPMDLIAPGTLSTNINPDGDKAAIQPVPTVKKVSGVGIVGDKKISNTDDQREAGGENLSLSTDLSSLLANLLGPAGQLDAALELLRRYRNRRGIHPVETFNMALCLALRGEREEAADRAREVLEIDPGHQKARQLLEEIGYLA